MKENTMKKSIQALYLASLAILGTLAVALRAAALLTGFDFETGYFSDKLINNISVVITVSAAVLFLTSLIYKRDCAPRVEVGSPKDYATSACVGTALVISAFEIFRMPISTPTASTPDVATIITSLATLLAAVAAFYFFFSILLGRTSPKIGAAFSMVLMLYLALYAMMLYFDKQSAINAPVKLCDQMAYLALAIFFASETRVHLARPLWRLYIASGLLAVLLSAYSSIPALIVYFVRGEIVSHTISESVLTLSLFAFCLVRIISAITADDDRESRVVAMVKKMHGERVKAIEAAAATRAQYNNNEENESEESPNYEIELPDASKSDTEERTDA